MKRPTSLHTLLTLLVCFFSGSTVFGQNVGIGTDTPLRRLHIAQENNTGHVQPLTGLLRLQNTQNTTCPGTVNVWDFRVGNCGQMGIATYLTNTTPFFNVLKASTNDATPSDGPVFSVNVTAPQNTLMISAEGNVSIGYIPAPPAAAKLDVQQGGPGVIARLRATGTGNQWVEIGNGSSTQNLGVGGTAPTSGVPYIWSSQGNFMIGNDGAPNVFIEGMGNTGRMGLGTTTPAHRLHVVGTGFASADFRAPIFYDSDNTAYFLNPAASSNVYDLTGRMIYTAGGGYFQSTGTGAGVFFADRGNAARNFGWYAESDAAYLWNNANGIRMSVNLNGATSISGSDAAYFFQNREGGANWGWYSSGNIARLWNSTTSDRLWVDTPGNLYLASNEIRKGNHPTTGGTVRLNDGDNNIWFDWTGTTFRMMVDVTQVKTFIIDHPTDADRYLVHAAIEGPENGVYYRGTAQLQRGQATITLPDYFDALTKDGSATVILTPRGKKPFLLSYDEVVGNQFTVFATEADGQFDWEVKANRQDAPDLLIEPQRDEVLVYGDGPYKYYGVKALAGADEQISANNSGQVRKVMVGIGGTPLMPAY